MNQVSSLLNTARKGIMKADKKEDVYGSSGKKFE